MTEVTEVASVLAANEQFYAAFESADFDAMQVVWADTTAWFASIQPLHPSGAGQR